MAYQQDDGGFRRQMFQGNWKCSQCGADITELPFEPDPSRVGQLQCRDCHRQRRNEGGGGGGGGRGDFQRPRQTFQGNWKCSSCGGDITELPFEPDPARLSQLLCKNCHRQRRAF